MNLTEIEILKNEILKLTNIISSNRMNQKLSCKKYQKTTKGKLAQAKANKKYRPSTGRPRGRIRN